MIDEIRKKVVTDFEKLCRKHKINNWQKEVFASNAIELLGVMDDKIDDLEKKIKELTK
jgi:hypothetical protein